jgi:hypothetical protein
MQDTSPRFANFAFEFRRVLAGLPGEVRPRGKMATERPAPERVSGGLR